MTTAAGDPRKERAAATRHRMVKAAYDLFSTRGLSIPMTAIAEEAGVAVQTLYFTFHTKTRLLMEAHDYAVMGERGIAPPDQPALIGLRETTDQRSVIAAIVAVSCDIIPRVGPLLWHMQEAVEDTEIMNALAHREQLRVDGYVALVDELMRRGPLREGVDRQEALDVLLSLTSSAVALFFLRERGWSLERWSEWTIDSISALLLPGR